jgi:hypothetical protein
MHEKIVSSDLILFGTTHRQAPILSLLADLLPQLAGLGVSHLALEIATDQQDRLDDLRAGRCEPSDIAVHPAIDCPAYRRLFDIIRHLPAQDRPRLWAVDLPAAYYDGPISRDQWMARRLAAIWDRQPAAKVMVVLGSLHVLHKLDWQDHLAHQHAALRSYLETLHPHLKMHSVVNVIGGAPKGGDFSRKLKPAAAPVAVDVDKRFASWQLGLTRCIAIKPGRPHELTDGVIIY